MRWNQGVNYGEGVCVHLWFKPRTRHNWRQSCLKTFNWAMIGVRAKITLGEKAVWGVNFLKKILLAKVMVCYAHSV